MTEAIEKLETLRINHEKAGQGLLKFTAGKLFPCHALYLSVLNRSLELFDGFILLIRNGQYGCGMSLLRMQLDNVLRFYGVLLTEDPHNVANEMFNGAFLSKIKDKEGNKLRDHYLVTKMSEANPWVNHVYNLTSGYIHLSDQHIHQMLGRSKLAADGEREFYLGSDSSHLDETHVLQLIQAFSSTTNGVFALLPEWQKLSSQYDPATLEKQYKVYA